jgi:hypothetical protein
MSETHAIDGKESGMKGQGGRLGRVVRLATWGIAVAALVQELRKPKDEREWHGTVGGLVPYDYRLPTMQRIKDRLWNPNGPVVSPQVFGVGWSVNFGRLASLARERTG